jgi:formate dehydrogenase subunit gamma
MAETLRDIIRPIGLGALSVSFLGLLVHYLFTKMFGPAREKTDTPPARDVERYRKPARVLHWVEAGAFVILLVTGLSMYTSGTGASPAAWLRSTHQVAAAVFIVAPLIYLLFNRRRSLKTIKEAFTWEEADYRWIITVPRVYFLRDESGLPPMGYLNPAQKLWWLSVTVLGPVSVLTGITMGLAGSNTGVFQWAALFHDASFLIITGMFLLHVYLSVVNPPEATGEESWSAMTTGKISGEYARTHHLRWYEEIGREKTEKREQDDNT